MFLLKQMPCQLCRAAKIKHLRSAAQANVKNPDNKKCNKIKHLGQSRAKIDKIRP
jgi:hypothetical protein